MTDKKTIRIDGSYGEGGGQILRTALALSAVVRKPIEIANIRKARPKPGLQPQHLTSVNAAARICSAVVEGAALSSTGLSFLPGATRGGDYSFDVSDIKGSAGSTSLIFQTIVLPLLFAERQSTITLMGGTHVPWSPTFHYLKQVFLPMLSIMNAEVELNIEQWGWYPRGGGRVAATVTPCRGFRAITFRERGNLKRMAGVSAVSNLPFSIADRQRAHAVRTLLQNGIESDIEIVTAPSIGKGTLLFLLAEFEHAKAGFGGLGAIGKRAEAVADEACSGMLRHLAAGGALDPHFADQVVPYLALASGESEFTTSSITRHLLTNIWVVKQFINRDIQVDGREGNAGSVRITPAELKA